LLPFFAAAMLFPATSFAVPGTLRIVDWNIEDDIDGATTPLPGFNTVLQGMGNEIIGSDPAQPIDIMTLEETTSNATTVQPILNMLNGDYAGANYKMSPYQATQNGTNTDGNGPNALVYNANTVQLLASVGVGTPEGGSNGEYRQAVRYEFQPVGYSGNNGIFYVYVSHMKSGSTSTDATDRGEEAVIIRNNEATLPANASVLYTGDLNSSPPEAEFTTFTASGQGEAYDPLNFSTSVQYWSESSTDLRYRDDYQLMTSNVLTGTGAINYVSGTLHSFGNDNTTPSGGNVDSPSTTGGSNTALNYMFGTVGGITYGSGNYPNQSQVLSALTTASDHLPNVADYTIAPLHPGDANGDGVVDINDMTIVLANYNQTGMVWSQGDFTGDGTVDINDMTIVLANYNQTFGASIGMAPVPEPSTFALGAAAALVLAAVAASRRRSANS
jgi:hypothetical protein